MADKLSQAAVISGMKIHLLNKGIDYSPRMNLDSFSYEGQRIVKEYALLTDQQYKELVEALTQALEACMEDLEYQLNRNDSIRGCTAMRMGRDALIAVKGADDGE